MAARCKETRELEVHHKDRSRGNTLSNAEVLCIGCHMKTGSYGDTRQPSAPPFSETTKNSAQVIARGRCECTRENCHS